ncbi:AAA family ATPase [Evansella tamaricis]|uniref:P-loop NTPase n=1 Tax=Evansella tamaricis TaxID=2069301 RepID=A0ABS6JDD0_9BACI|nr:P-loop NTPase [Evansella tamaricis]MBU9711581.1 P-loop NTPase [Evansella tamaricis]
MRLNYFILSEKQMYSTAIKLMFDDLKKSSRIFDIFTELKTSLEHVKGTVVVIGPNSMHNPYDICQEISHTYPLTSVVLLLKKSDIDYKKAMYAGAIDVLDIECDEEEVIEAIQKAETVTRLKMEAEYGDSIDKQAKIITVCSSKGGVGKSTISVNTAVALRKDNLKVAVLDLDLQFGDIALLFDQQPIQTIYDWVKGSYEHGDKSFKPYLLKHKSGVDIMAAPLLPEFAELIKGEHIAYLLDAMKEEFDYIVVDTPPAFVETSLVALENSDVILLIASLDLPALKNGKLAIETLSLLGFKDKIQVILNRDTEMEGMTKETVEDVLGLAIHGTIPSDYRTVISSINKGEPFVEMSTRTPVAKAVLKIVKGIIHSFSLEEQETKNKTEKETTRKKKFFFL